VNSRRWRQFLKETFAPRGGEALVAYLAVAVALGACAPRKSNHGNEPISSESALVFKHFRIPQGEYLSRWLAEFEKQHPGIRVKDEVLPASTDQQHQFYVTNLEGHSPDFDVLALDVIWTPEFSRAGWLEDLTPYFPPDTLAQFLPAPVQANTHRGRLYAAPWYIDAGLLYYRKDLLEQYGLHPPKTFEELVTSTQIILQRERNPNLYGFIWQGKQYEGLVCNVLEYIWGNGGDILDASGRVVLNSPRAIAAVQFMHDLIYRYRVSPEWVTTADEEATRHTFGAGKAIYMRNWPYAWNLFQQEGSAVRGKVGITVMPHFPGGTSAATLGGWQLGVNRYSRHKEAAIELVRFLTSQTSQRYIALTMGFKPTRKALYADEVLKAQQPFIVGLYDVLLQAKPRPVTPFYLMMSQILQPEFSAAIVGIKTPEKALESAAEQIIHLLGMEALAWQGLRLRRTL